jgi:PAS domain S-box-containing protein
MTSELKKDLLERIRSLQERLDEAEETLRALRSGEVDAVVAAGPDGDQVYTLKGPDEAYRVMVENMAEGALTLTRDGLILFSNEQFASLRGIPLERVIGSSMRDFLVVEDTLVLSALLGHSTRAEAQLRLKKGAAAWVPVHISASTLLLDEAECVCLVVTDLTEQKRNQEIVAAELLARSILDQAAGAIVVVDPAGKIIRASRAAGQLANTAVLLRQFDDVFRLRINSDAIANSMAMDYTFEEILSTLQRHGSVADLEARAQVPDGQMRDVMVSAGLLTGAHSECLGCIVQISDVSRLKLAEQEIRSLNADLEQRVRSRTAALEATNKELESFAYLVAHDLRTPLRGIDGWSLAVLEDSGDHLDPQAREHLGRVRAEAQHMGRLIDDLLHLAHLGRVEMSPREVDLTALAETLSARLKKAHSDRALEFAIEPGLSSTGDAPLLEVVLTNLLENAVKFTRPRAQARIEFGKTECNGESAFFVRDNGVGFDMSYAGKLFRTFQRLHKASEFPGTGIGLATVKRVIDRHGGRAWAEGRGGEFLFHLGCKIMNNKTILLIEDNASDAELTERALRKAHILVDMVIASDGQEALNYLFGSEWGADHALPAQDLPALPAIALLDLNFPKVSGLEVLRKIRADDRTRRMPVVILTSSKQEEDLAAGYDLGANSYIRKPVDFKEFSEAVRQLGFYWLALNEAPPKTC